MNKYKLSALCAKARGWHTTDTHPMSNKWYYDDEGRPTVPIIDYEPTDDAAQADEVLETVAATREWWVLKCPGFDKAGDYECAIRSRHYPEESLIGLSYAKTQNLAKILCALRASDKVTDAEINDAMEGE